MMARAPRLLRPARRLGVWDLNSLGTRLQVAMSMYDVLVKANATLADESERPAVHCEVIQALQTVGTVNVFVICLDKVNSAHNVIDRPFGLGLARAVYLAREKASKGDVDVVVLCSAKERSFLAGADIAHELKYVGVDGSKRAFTDLRQFQDVLCVLEALPVPTVAVVNGAALGGGLELALACDYRIADAEHCTQIGLPEVKLGYLPGAGGCCRLPRLIGFRPSLDLILSGRSVTAQQALKLGIVDHLMVTTETTARDQGHGWLRSYNYKWFSSILACIEGGKLGKKTFDVCERDGLSAVDACLNVNFISEDVMMAALVGNWEACERKAARKYPRQGGGGRWSLAREYLVNVFFYLVALYQLWRRVGFTMPAPYTALHTTLRCLYAGSWLEAMQLNALGFVSVATTAEAKSLSSLFLLTRKLKGHSLAYGLDPSKKTQAALEKLDKENSVVLVTVSKEGMGFSSAFTQSLLYSGLEVHAVCSGQQATVTETFRKMVRKQFDYSLKRGHLKEAEVRSKMDRLHLFSRSSELAKGLAQVGDKQRCVVVHASFSGEKEALIGSLGRTYPKVVHLDLCPSSQPAADEHVVLVNVGDPVRKNTLCVELSPASARVSPEDIRIAAALVNTLGKIPVVTPPSPLRSASHYLAVHQWSLAVNLMAKSGLSPARIDASLTRAGFSRGPFAVMKQLDRAYVSQMVQLGSHSGIDCRALKSYLTGKLTVKYRRGKAPSGTEVADLFLAGAVHSALLVRKLSPDIPEAAIDILSISGLTQFPPSEGGPLTYVTRIGANRFERRLEELAYVPAIGNEAETLLRSCKVLSETKSKLFRSKDDREEEARWREAAEIQGGSSDLVLLTAKELETVGPTRGLTNQEVLLYPLPAVAGFTAALLVLLILAPILLYLLLSLFM